MTNEEAIRILKDELKHTEFHLKDKNKSPEFYKEMRSYCEAYRLAIRALKLANTPKVIHCKDCKYQKKYWHEDKRMKEGGYWVYNCYFICDPFESGPVCGEPEEYCSSAEQKGEEE